MSAIRDYLKEEACKKRHRGESKEDDFDLTHKYLDRAWCIETLVGKKHYTKNIKPVLLAKVWHKNDIPVHTLCPSEAQALQTQMAEEALAENVRPGGKVLVFFCMIPGKTC